MRKYLLIFFLFPFLLSCNFNNQISENESVHTIELENCEYISELSTSFFCKESVAILLEENDNSRIGYVSKIEIIENMIYIMDGRIAKALFVFNKDGKFINKIGQTGKGPGEYIDIIDFAINAKDNCVYILTYGKLLKYSLNGTFIENINVDSNVIGVFWSNNTLFMKHLPKTNKNINIVSIINDEGKLVNSWLSNEKYGKGFYGNMIFSRRPFIGDDRKVKFFTYFNNTVYCFKDGEVFPYLEIIAKNSFEKSDVKRYCDLKIRSGVGHHKEISKLFKDKFWGIQNYFEVGKLILIESTNNEFSFRIIYNTENKKSYYTHSILNDEFGTSDLIINNVTDEYVIGIAGQGVFLHERKNIINLVKKGIIDSKNEIKEFEKNENPIIMLYKIKDIYL